MKAFSFPPSLDWNYNDIMSLMPEFLKVYEKRPINDNEGGMKSPHMFALFCFLKRLNPEVVIESGVWHGQGTWFIENVLPEAKIYSIDPRLDLRQYISKKATYYDKDFASIDWSVIKNKEKTLLFFDDHQNALNRIKVGRVLGFKDFIFEDNYPAGQGDCYSLKRVFAHVGFGVKPTGIRALLGMSKSNFVKANSIDADYLNSNLSVYYEFPPVYKPDLTRWGDKWTDDKYPTPQALMTASDPKLKIFEDDGGHYTWMCLASLK